LKRKRRKMTKRMMMRKKTKTKNPTIRRYSPHCSHLRRTRQ
jgi:hypothetical protein